MGTKLSQIAAAATPPTLVDTFIGVQGGTTDVQFSAVQVLNGIFKAAGTTYYINTAGSDSNPGTIALPWQTISHVNAYTAFKPGDNVLFQAGQTFTGNLVPPVGGSQGFPITFGSYGVGRATISAGSGTGLVAGNISYITVRDLIFTGTSSSNYGVDFANNLAGNIHLGGITLSNLDVSGFGYTGINFLGYNGTSGYDGVTISGCVSHGNCLNGGGGALATGGIYFFSSTGYGSGLTAPAFTNVLITNCICHDNVGAAVGPTGPTGFGIVLSQAGNSTIQYCTVYNNGTNSTTGVGPVGIITTDSGDITIQFCEAYNNGGTNSAGYDIDGGTTGCVIQYCYSHGNLGPGFLLASFNDGTITTWNNNTLRFCISETDNTGGTAGSLVFYVQNPSTMTNALVYGCTLFNNATDIVQSGANAVTSGKVANNIFYAASNKLLDISTNPTGLLFNGNNYYASSAFHITWNGSNYTTFAAWQTATSQEVHQIGSPSANPLLRSPGNGGTTNGYNPTILTAYNLLPGSVMNGSAVNYSTLSISPGTMDYYGNGIPYNNVSGAYNVGAGPVGLSLTSSTPSIRVKLIANTTFYVATTGNDTTGDGTSGNPWATLAKAWNYMATLDCNGFTLTIQLATGTYAGIQVAPGGNAAGGPVGGPVTIQGNTSDATLVIISDSNGAFYFESPLANSVTLQWMTIKAPGASYCLFVGAPGVVNLSGSLIFGATASYPITCATGGVINIVGGAISFTGSPTYAGVIAAQSCGSIAIFNGTNTFAGTATVTAGFAVALSCGNIGIFGATFAGATITGPRYSATLNGVINTFGEGSTYFPGSAGGTTDGFGVYA